MADTTSIFRMPRSSAYLRFGSERMSLKAWKTFCGALFLLVCVASSATDDIGSASARSLSLIGVEGVKLLVRGDIAAQSKVNVDCVNQLDDDVLATDIQAVLARKFAASELAEVDEFMATATAKSWVQLLLGLNVPESALDGFVPVVLTVEELQSIARFSATPAGRDFRARALGVDVDPEIKRAVNEGLRGAVRKCLK